MAVIEDRGPFEVWRTDTRNLFGAYRSLDEALGSVRALVNQHGTGAAEAMTLIFDDGEEFIDLATGAALATFALAGRVSDEVAKRIIAPEPVSEPGAPSLPAS
jgi:hypothetical protein